MKFSTWIAAVLICSVILFKPAQANAQSCDASDPDCAAANAAVAAATTTTILVVVLGAAIVVGIVFGVISTIRNANRSAEPRAAELYLRQNTLELAQDFASGSGPVINDFAAAMEIKREHLGTFRRTLQQHRGALMALADTAKLNPERAASFFKTMVSYLEANPDLNADFQGFMKHQTALHPAS